MARPFASVCKPPKVNLDYQRSKVHILGQLNCWQVWWQGLEIVLLCFALLVFCLCPSGLRRLAGCVLVREREESAWTLQVAWVLGAFRIPMEGCKSSCYCSVQVYLPWVHSMLLSTELSFRQSWVVQSAQNTCPICKGPSGQVLE